jgi:hypothetical protein
MSNWNWLDDFEIGAGAVRVRKTGAVVPIEGGVVLEVATWLPFFFTVAAAAPKTKTFTLAFSPDRARPWYLVWAAAQMAGARIIDDPAEADVIFHFEDATISRNEPPTQRRADARLVNFACVDVSKSRVAAAMEAVFGYPLALDPRVHQGSAVEKSERNGAHDGGLVTCPMEPRPGRVYQRLIDTERADGLVEDLRTPMVGGRPVCVYRKRRRSGERFANHNSEVELARVQDVFYADEVSALGRFAAEIGLEWGGVDVLRDAADGRLYVVDVNKTDMGPPIALPLKDKMDSTRALAAALRDLTMSKRA